ncbi:MAG: protoheme IX farnesyltransferase, partial [Cyanobacteriota bacterium]|nr:protoheme IX farnesyltransferase [Cyanobacteriota bacterium]
MVSATITSPVATSPPAAISSDAKRSKRTLPAWLEIAKPRLIPLLLATTLGGMALAEDWPADAAT